MSDCANKRTDMNRRVVIGAMVVGVLLFMGGFLAAFLLLGPVKGVSVNGTAEIAGLSVSNKLLLSQKIFYIHLPVALVSFASLLCACFFAVKLLIGLRSKGETVPANANEAAITNAGENGQITAMGSQEACVDGVQSGLDEGISQAFNTAVRPPLLCPDTSFLYDAASSVCMELAGVFALCTMITGIAWTRFEWGVWWTWEPRLTTFFILTLIIAVYFILRSSVQNPRQKSVFSAVLCLMAAIEVPFCFAVTRLIPSGLHPVVLRAGGLSTDMLIVVLVCLAGMACIAFGLFALRYCSLKTAKRVAVLQELLD